MRLLRWHDSCHGSNTHDPRSRPYPPCNSTFNALMWQFASLLMRAVYTLQFSFEVLRSNVRTCPPHIFQQFENFQLRRLSAQQALAFVRFMFFSESSKSSPKQLLEPLKLSQTPTICSISPWWPPKPWGSGSTWWTTCPSKSWATNFQRIRPVLTKISLRNPYVTTLTPVTPATQLTPVTQLLQLLQLPHLHMKSNHRWQI